MTNVNAKAITASQCFSLAKNLLRTIRINTFQKISHSLSSLSLNQIKFRKFRSCHEGKRCFIIGNGPSLTIEDLHKLASEYTFAANKIYLTFDRTKWRPTYYNVEDELVARQNKCQINQLNGFTKFFRKEFKNMLNHDANVIWYRDDHHYSPFPQFTKNASKVMYWGSSVTYISMQLAYYMGFTKIYLLGVDFNFAGSSKKLSDGSFISDGEVNHFTSDYRQPGEIWNQPNLDMQLEAFQHANAFALENGIRFLNATRGGKLEVFERVDFDSLF